ncbi:MAG: class I SAM-dependent methyltransferase [Deltaproteobacteria bacterium]|nr:class I SAM-dependent methyltransferase [Deltaproteobacteria bacterium]
MAPPAGSVADTVEAHRLRSRHEFLALVNDPVFAPRWSLERHLAELHQYETCFVVAGVCAVCRRAVDFAVDFDGAWEADDGLRIPNWRESMRCPRCGLAARQRRVSELVVAAVDDRRGRDPVAVYLMEALSPLYRSLSRRLLGATVVGSEYLADDAPGGTRPRSVRHEDAERLSFADASLDVLVSCDVFEHVNDPRRAFAEVARVLRTSGRAVLTFPVDLDVEHHRRRAERIDGEVRHLLPPIHHGNPLSSEGALVYTDFGWDVLGDLRDAGLVDPVLELYWGYDRGYLGLQFCVLAGKA